VQARLRSGKEEAASLSRRAIAESDRAVEHAFDRLAPAYTAIELRKRARETRRFIQWISPRASDRVLDLATGPALIARPLAAVARHIVALDLSFRMLNSARERRPLAPNISLVCGTTEHLPLHMASCDLVTCGYSFANFRRPLGVLREVTRVLAPSGRVALMEVVAPENPAGRRRLNRLEAMRARMFTRLRSYRQLVRLFERSGFSLESAQLHRRLRRSSDWLRLSPAAARPRRAGDLGRALVQAVREGKSGLRPVRGTEVEFYYQTAWLTFRRKA
jgi:ubiquinone/menaquinone biosynthesis C-methylase UbiE